MQFSEFVSFLKHIVELAEMADNIREKAVGADVATVSVANQYERLANADDRDALLKLCETKGVPVPPRTKTPTLARLLTEHDAKTLEAEPTSRGATAPTETVTDPFTEEPTDPFDDAPNKAPATPVNTVAMVRKALMSVHETKGLAAVMDILMTYGGGCTKIKELQEAYYPAVYAEASK